MIKTLCPIKSTLNGTSVMNRLISNSRLSMSTRTISYPGIYTKLNRSLVKVDGVDSFRFIQNLMSRNLNIIWNPDLKNVTDHHVAQYIAPEAEVKPQMIYTSFMNSQGRIQYDAFIHPADRRDPSQGYIIDTDGNIGSEAIIAQLNKFKLRTKVKFTEISDHFSVYSVLGTDRKILEDSELCKYVYDDPRTTIMGLRIVVPSQEKVKFPSILHEATQDDYKLFRMLKGVPEGKDDFWEQGALPFEHILEELNGVSFNKGCYIGQELTNRTHSVGVTRKRIFPVAVLPQGENPSVFSRKLQSYDVTEMTSLLRDVRDGEIEGDKVISESGKPSGKIYEKMGGLALAMVRLEHLNETDIESTILTSESKTKQLCVIKPFWWDQYAEEKHKKDKQLIENIANTNQL